jgi:hypothetical protein
VAIVLWSVSTLAAPIPSKVDAPRVVARDVHVAPIENVLARNDVADALRSYGLSADEVQSRLVRLSDDDIRHLASNLEQIQAAGEEVPEYMWWLAGGLLAAIILIAIL